MPFELGVYSFGNTPRTYDGGYGPTSQAVRDALEAVRLADEVGLDFFGFGEHHTASMPLSSPTAMVTAAAATTNQIRIGTAVTVLSTDDPIRVFEQLAVADALAPGRIEAVAGRGSSNITFDLFDEDESNYDMLFSSKLDLLLAINAGENVTFTGPHRHKPLRNTTIYPRPDTPLPIWLGTGGSPNSVMRAVELGLPMFIGVLGGNAEHWANYGRAYRQAWAQTGRPDDTARVAVAVHGFVGPDDAAAKKTYLDHELAMFRTGAAEAGRPPMTPTGREHDLTAGAMVFAGSPDDITERILHLHSLLGHDRQILQMDVGGMPQAELLRSIELLGTEVAPQVRHELTDLARPTVHS